MSALHHLNSSRTPIRDSDVEPKRMRLFLLPKICYTFYMNITLLNENKAKLLEEQKRLQAMLNQDTTPDSEIPGGHKPKFTEVGSEQGENASESEQFGNELSVTEDLDARLVKVTEALARIEDGTYGKCLAGGEEIDERRLSAEPAAESCIKHSK